MNTTVQFSLDQINKMPVPEFVSNFGGVAEFSPWVAKRAINARPFADFAHLCQSFLTEVDQASQSEALSLLRAHPDLADRAAQTSGLTAHSSKEQAGAGLDQLSESEFVRFSALNANYKKRFGFPFIFAVKGADKYQILNAFEARVGNTRDAELVNALNNVKKIINFRLQDLCSLTTPANA